MQINKARLSFLHHSLLLLALQIQFKSFNYFFQSFSNFKRIKFTSIAILKNQIQEIDWANDINNTKKSVQQIFFLNYLLIILNIFIYCMQVLMYLLMRSINDVSSLLKVFHCTLYCYFRPIHCLIYNGQYEFFILSITFKTFLMSP